MTANNTVCHSEQEEHLQLLIEKIIEAAALADGRN